MTNTNFSKNARNLISVHLCKREHMNNSTEQKFISKAEVFRRLGLYPAIGDRLIESRVIGPFHQVGRLFLFEKTDMPRFAEAIKPALAAIADGKGPEYFRARFAEVAA